MFVMLFSNPNNLYDIKSRVESNFGMGMIVQVFCGTWYGIRYNIVSSDGNISRQMKNVKLTHLPKPWHLWVG